MGVVAAVGGGVKQQQSLSVSEEFSFKSSSISIDSKSLTIFCFFLIFTKGSNILLCFKEISFVFNNFSPRFVKIESFLMFKKNISSQFFCYLIQIFLQYV